MHLQFQTIGPSTLQKQIYLKREKEDFYQNNSKMLDYIDERYKVRCTKLLQSYDITSFEKSWNRKVLQALIVILGKKTQIEAYEAMMRMAFNIIEAHIFYDFPTFISNEARKNLFKIEKIDFWHSSYFWWLIVHQNVEALVEGGIQVEPTILTTTPMPIDLIFPILTKLHGSYYEFMEKFYALVVQILTGKAPHRLHQSTMQEL